MTNTDSTYNEIIESNSKSEFQDSNDNIYLLALGIGLVHYLLPETTLEVPDIIELFLKGSMFLLLTMQLIIAFPKYSNNQKLLILILFLLVAVVGYSTTYWGTVYSLYALIVGAKGIDYRKILKVYFKVGSILCLTVVSLSLLGVIENVGYISEGHGLDGETKIRYCLGYIWPTDFASHVFFVLLSFWILAKGRLTLIQSLLFLIIAYIVYSVSDSNLGTGCILLLVIFTIYLKLKERLMERFKVFSKRTFLSRYLWLLYIPFMFFVSIWTAASYDEGSLLWLTANILLSNRLALGHQILEKEGYTIFGQKYTLMGGTTDANLYNFIDSSFLQSFIIYGLVFSVILALSYMRVSRAAYNQKNYAILYAILIAGISGAIAQHFLQIFMNPLLIALTASNTNLSIEENGRGQFGDSYSNDHHE